MDIEKEIKSLLESKKTGYQISKKTGVSEAVVSKLRNGEREVKNLTVETAQKLIDYKGEIEMKKEYYVNLHNGNNSEFVPFETLRKANNYIRSEIENENYPENESSLQALLVTDNEWMEYREAIENGDDQKWGDMEEAHEVGPESGIFDIHKYTYADKKGNLRIKEEYWEEYWDDKHE